MMFTRWVVVGAWFVVLTGGNPLRADDRESALERRKAEVEALQKKLQADLARLMEEHPRGPIHPPLPRIDPPFLPNLRGEVTNVAGDLLIIDIGIDAGLSVGTVLEIDRIDGAKSRFLGTVKATDAFNLYPKQAVVKFTPVRKVPLKDLKPEELPKKGDLVRPLKPRD